MPARCPWSHIHSPTFSGPCVVSTGKLRSLTVRRAIPATPVAPLTYAVAEFHPDPLQPDTIGWAPPSTASELAYQVVYSGGYAMLAVPLLFVVAVAIARDRRHAAVGHWGAKPLETNETDGASADEDGPPPTHPESESTTA